MEFVTCAVRRRELPKLPSTSPGGWKQGGLYEPPRQDWEVPQSGVPECRVCGHRNSGCRPPFPRGSRLHALWSTFRWYYSRHHYVITPDGNRETCVGSWKVANRVHHPLKYYGKKPG